ncbi:tRNA (guanine(10)-N(2))-dimethyltransferase [Thermococcus sp.]|uniref:tRNA (guanine(10)-N(2))-dimethyltransferase n=1 Tax=Thermococcus sp. TaxID=35749 RepID=UPI00260FB5DC|nr:tRNA (guanine(10)-N(2))-dimethyltransferase [Thermococcus sp.]
MELVEITEGKARILVPRAARIYDAPVFYNPVMALNRDLSVLALRVLSPERVLDALSATGVRGIRYALETPAREVWLNDIKPEAFKLILRNVRLNFGAEAAGAGDRRELVAGGRKLVVTRADANGIMGRAFRYFDFIDLDPFGSPMEFLDSALRSVRRRGALGITATDTGVLCGAYRNACRRRYLAEPVRGYLCHEAGLRILLGSAVRYAAKYDLGVEVLLAYYRDHYFRAFLRLTSGAKRADKSLGELGYLYTTGKWEFEYEESFLPARANAHGPMWLGPLKDEGFVEKMVELAGSDLASGKSLPFLRLLSEELDVPFHYDTHVIAGAIGTAVPKVSAVIQGLRELGYLTTRTHFSPTSIKTTAPPSAVVDVIRGVSGR